MTQTNSPRSTVAPGFARPTCLLVAVAAAVLSGTAGCRGTNVTGAEPLEFEVVATYPHDAQAFTQGLLFHQGFLYESTGQYGKSTLRRVALESGRVDRLIHLPDRFFGEGLALLGDRLFQLTWKSGTGFIYDRESLQKEGEFRYEGEGWGLTTDGILLIISDGSATLRFLDPVTFAEIRRLEVRDSTGPVDRLNELEMVEGEIYANRWERDEVVRISPENGRITGKLQLARLERPRPRNPDAVANGIAYDAETGVLYVTGKLWPNLYGIRILSKP